MEHWILHYDAHYDAVPWPFAVPWETFVKQPQPLVHPADDFGRAALCDGLSETPSVPSHLPRLVPRGRYRLAIYHDADWLYAFLDAENGPVIVPAAEIDHMPQLDGMNRSYSALVLLRPDQRLTYHFGLDDRGQPSAGIRSIVYGARKLGVPSRAFQWEIVVVPRATGELTGWRIARASIGDAFTGNTLRVSVSRMHFETLEHVAWGSPTAWGPRPDEFGTVRLVEKREPPPWPVARRVEMHYDPETECSTFHIRWEGNYQPSETDVPVPISKGRAIPWRQFGLRLNGEQRSFDLGESVTTGEFAIVDGDNRLEIASVGGPAVRIDFEKRSGNRIREDPSNSAPPEPAGILERVRRDCAAHIAAMESRRSSGTAPMYRNWCTYEAASLGRVHHYLDPDPRLLDVLREQADFALSLQRADGSFAGYHLARWGHPPGLWAAGAYDTGPAGELWVVAAWLLKDEKYLAASQRLLRAYKDYRVEFNYNYAAFTLYHLVAHYRLTRDPLALEHARYYARHCVAIDLLPLGFHAGHNYYTCYGSITLRGLAQLCAVLPKDDPYRATLREQCLRMTNQVLARQQPDGSFDGRDRFFLDERFWSWGLFSVAFLLPPAAVARLDAAILRLLRFPGETDAIGGTTGQLAESDFVRYWAHRETLLAGGKLIC